MRSNFQTLKLRDVIEIVIDNRGRNPKSYSDYGVPVIDNYLIVSEAEADLSQVKRYIDEHTYNTFIRKYLSKGDVLMTLVGNGYGKVAITPEQQCIIIQNTIGLRCNKDNDNLYLYYLLKANREVLMNLNRGAAQPSIKVGDILDLEFTFPPLHIQQKIGSTLGDLDKKSSLNSQTNQTLEQMAQAIFKSWFVDFDPVRAKMKGEQPEGVDAATASLFPEKLVESELGLTPEGWPVGKLSELIKFANGKSGKKSDSGQFPLYGANGIIGFSEEAKFEDAVIIGRVGAYCGAIEYCNSQFWASDNTIVATAKSGKEQLPFVLYLLKYLDLNQHAGGAAQPLLNQKVLNSLEVPIPTDAVLERYGELLSTMLDKMTHNIEENHNLESLRDTLLPKLLSGEIDLETK